MGLVLTVDQPSTFQPHLHSAAGPNGAMAGTGTGASPGKSGAGHRDGLEPTMVDVVTLSFSPGIGSGRRIGTSCLTDRLLSGGTRVPACANAVRPADGRSMAANGDPSDRTETLLRLRSCFARRSPLSSDSWRTKTQFRAMGGGRLSVHPLHPHPLRSLHSA